MSKKSVAPAGGVESKRKTAPPAARGGANLTKPALGPQPTAVAKKPPPIPAVPATNRHGIPRPATPVAEPRASAPPSRRAPGLTEERAHQLESIGRGLAELRELVAGVASSLDALREKERGLSPEGAEQLAEISSKLRLSAGGPPSRKGGPPPIPSGGRGLDTNRCSAMDISEIAELVESLAPPPLPEIDVEDVEDASW